MENREVPILHNLRPLAVNAFDGTRKFFVCRYLPATKNNFLCALCTSVVNAIYFVLHLSSNAIHHPRLLSNFLLFS